MAVYKGRLFAGTLPSGHVHSIEVGRNVTYDTALRPGWRHIAAVKSKTRLKLYMDGKPVATSTTFDSVDYDLSSSSPLRIGFGPHDYFQGRMSDLRIYNRALDAGDVAKLANKPRDDK